MRREVRYSGVVVGALLVLAVGCTAGDVYDSGDGDTEVGGAVLERDGSGEPIASDDPDEPRVDPREERADAETGAGSSDAQEQDDATSDVDPELPAEGGSGDGASSPQRGESSPDEPVQDTEPSTSGDEQPAAPAPRRGPEPQRLAAGPGLPGDLIGFGPDGTEVLVGGALSSPPEVGARSDAVRDAAEHVTCVSSLQAPQDRGLLAEGELTVTLVTQEHDGTVRREPLLIMELDVHLPAGERHELPPTKPRAIDRDVAASLACEAHFEPA